MPHLKIGIPKSLQNILNWQCHEDMVAMVESVSQEQEQISEPESYHEVLPASSQETESSVSETESSSSTLNSLESLERTLEGVSIDAEMLNSQDIDECIEQVVRGKVISWLRSPREPPGTSGNTPGIPRSHPRTLDSWNIIKFV